MAKIHNALPKTGQWTSEMWEELGIQQQVSLGMVLCGQALANSCDGGAATNKLQLNPEMWG